MPGSEGNARLEPAETLVMTGQYSDEPSALFQCIPTVTRSLPADPQATPTIPHPRMVTNSVKNGLGRTEGHTTAPFCKGGGCLFGCYMTEKRRIDLGAPPRIPADLRSLTAAHPTLPNLLQRGEGLGQRC